MKTTLIEVAAAEKTLRPFLSASQFAHMREACRGEDGKLSMCKVVDLARQIATMPKTFEQGGKGDQASAQLHYFLGASDWFIIERDFSGGVKQALGYVIPDGDSERAELVNISIEEITRKGAELDLHFTPCAIAEIKAQRAAEAAQEARNAQRMAAVRRSLEPLEFQWDVAQKQVDPDEDSVPLAGARARFAPAQLSAEAR
jgi:hypothetical protein